MLRNGSGRQRHRIVLGFLAALLTASLVMASPPVAVSSPGLEKVDRRVLRMLQGGRTVAYWVLLRQKADLSGASKIKDWNERGSFVYRRLNAVANSSQKGLRDLLRSRGVSAKAFWIINAIRVKSTIGMLGAVAAREDVEGIVPDWTARIPNADRSAEVAAVEWNIARIRAPEVWSTYNDRGEGITVANIDTGVQWNHTALFNQYRGFHMSPFRPLFPSNDYNWYDPSRVCSANGRTVCDNNGHGTAVMGVIVGDDGGSNQIGVAPRAHWIAAKGCESNSCSSSALLQSGQWMLAPTDLNDQNPRSSLRPHVINSSWGGGPGDPWYRATVQAWVASGIYPVFAVGGSGPGCGTVSSPADYPESYGVGAFDMNNNIASFSSRGPSSFGGIIKPNVTAPGVSIRTSWNNNGYLTLSGSSFATPHVVGTVALIWAGAPSFARDIAGTRAVVDQTAIDVSNLTCGGSPGNNNVWGEGRLDAFAAVTAARGSSDGAPGSG
jgi:subtilisin family serine protease